MNQNLQGNSVTACKTAPQNVKHGRNKWISDKQITNQKHASTM